MTSAAYDNDLHKVTKWQTTHVSGCGTNPGIGMKLDLPFFVEVMHHLTSYVVDPNPSVAWPDRVEHSVGPRPSADSFQYPHCCLRLGQRLVEHGGNWVQPRGNTNLP